ncbi:MAG: hypothetical protein PHQ00_01100 [Phycisphaerae bacterium]|nr:hypothetical protein [Phycisphaerae bacterium]
MINKTIITVLICLSSFSAFGKDISDKLKDSIVYLQISYHGYEQYQPWRNKDLSESSSVGCAVSANTVITTADSIADAVFIRAKKAEGSEYIPAKIKIVDYESNLAMLELDANSLGRPLKPLVFAEKYRKGAAVDFYWLSATEQIYNGRAFLDRVAVGTSAVSFVSMLTFVAAGTSDSTASGHLYCLDDKPLGIACWSNTNKEAGIIPAKVINRFLADAKGDKYDGIGMIGFQPSELLEPAMRKYLKMPDSLQSGVYISSVYTIGTGSDVFEQGDVLLSIDGFSLNPYGKFKHPQYDILPFDYLITGKTAGEKITFDIWRSGKKQTIETAVKNFSISDMLVPSYELDRQPEYIIIGGCIFQRLTKSYLTARGENWQGMVEPHIYDYMLNQAFKPTEQRKEIVVLSYVLPANINLGYHGLSQCVVESINGMKISSVNDIPQALALNPQEKYHIIKFEMDRPDIVLDRSQLESADAVLARNYGINKLSNINSD